MGQILGIADDFGCITMPYQQINKEGELRSETCISTPKIKENGKLKLHELWKRTSGELSEGSSILEEI